MNEVAVAAAADRGHICRLGSELALTDCSGREEEEEAFDKSDEWGKEKEEI
jgi:hypothetical protein